ncbi:MAG: hypothetical protein K0B84_10845 [Firmicutes bacterium]|nr:hypothetical protein [Bacillota bacterium]
MMSIYTGKDAGEFIAEAKKIINQAEQKGAPLRLIGALAFHLHCPKYNYIHKKWGRVFTDTDFVAKREHHKEIIEAYAELGYKDDEMITTLYGSDRLVFDNPETGMHSDIFFDKLDYCHVLQLRDRLNVDDLTIPLAELFLEKMQIVQINEKDIVDTMMLLAEHPVGESDNEEINGPVIAGILASEWGFWRTVTGNIDKMLAITAKTDLFDSEEKNTIEERIAKIRDYVDREPKPLAWKMRSKVGDKVKWYKEVDEL